jgi:hypothetical protein
MRGHVAGRAGQRGIDLRAAPPPVAAEQRFTQQQVAQHADDREHEDDHQPGDARSGSRCGRSMARSSAHISAATRRSAPVTSSW